jgi:hypothetical protein
MIKSTGLDELYKDIENVLQGNAGHWDTLTMTLTGYDLAAMVNERKVLYNQINQSRTRTLITQSTPEQARDDELELLREQVDEMDRTLLMLAKKVVEQESKLDENDFVRQEWEAAVEEAEIRCAREILNKIENRIKSMKTFNATSYSNGYNLALAEMQIIINEMRAK